MTTPRKHLLLSVIGAVAMLTFLACGEDSPKASSEPGVFYKSDAGTIKVYPGSQEVGPAQSSGDTLTRTYSVAASPTEVSQFYTDSLRDWAPVQAIAPSPATPNQYKAAWEHGGDRLELITDLPAPEAGANPTIRYSLVLHS